MSCDNCQYKKTSSTSSIPYIVYEAATARYERTIKQFWITVILLIILLVGTNLAWIYHISQYDTTETIVEAVQGDGINIVGGGNIDYGTESEDNNEETSA